MSGALLVCGTHSDAGKSVVVAGICRWLVRQGVSVAPFKAQNMALNSVVTLDGAEVGRAQAVQAQAARVRLEAAMNPVLIKPAGERHSQIVVMGEPYADADAFSYRALKDELRPVVTSALADLRRRYDVVVCEGAGSPAEINLRDGDLVNMGLARDAGLPVLIVADIDRGGVFASLLGTLAVLAPEDQRHVAGFVINKFRGEQAILAPGVEELGRLTGRPSYGVLPYLEGMHLDVEDSLALDAPGRPSLPPRTGGEALDVAVLRLRWISNFTDVDALACEPGVQVRFTRNVADVARADLVVIPGTKATVEDLDRLRDDGLDVALRRRATAGDPILGICGGYQLLGERIDDTVESKRGVVPGLGLLPVTTAFAPDKVRRRVDGRSELLDAEASGYEIRHGRVERHGGAPLIEGEGCLSGKTVGTSWHGILENDRFRRNLLAWVAHSRGRRFVAGETPFAEIRERRLDALGDMIEQHADTDSLRRLIEGGVPSDLPTVTCSVS